MNKGIAQARIIFIDILFVAFLLLMQLLFSSADSDTQLVLTAVLAIMVISFILISSFSALKRIDCYMIFMSLSFFFMFGEQLLYLFGIRVDEMWIYRGLLRQDTIYVTAFFTLYTYLVMHLGYSLVLHKRVSKVNLPDENADMGSRKRLMKAGIVVALIAIVPTAYYLGRKIFLSIILGYGEMLNEMNINGEGGIDTLVVILSSFMIPALLSMFIAKNKESRWPWVLIAVYVIAYMLSGSRIDSFCLMCGILYANILVHSKLTKKSFVTILVVGVSIAVVFSFVSHSRNNQESTNKEVASQLVEENPVTEILKEMGFTFCATGVVIEHCPSDKPFLYGQSYLSGLLYALPNAITGSYYTKTPEVDSGFKDYISTGGGIGSSFIAEGYYNFGWYSILLFLLYGYMGGVLCCKLERSVNRCNYSKIFLYIGIFCIVVLYVRSDTRTFFRHLVWTYAPIYLYSKANNKSRRKVVRYKDLQEIET